MNFRWSDHILLWPDRPERIDSRRTQGVRQAGMADHPRDTAIPYDEDGGDGLAVRGLAGISGAPHRRLLRDHGICSMEDTAQFHVNPSTIDPLAQHVDTPAGPSRAAHLDVRVGQGQDSIHVAVVEGIVPRRDNADIGRGHAMAPIIRPLCASLHARVYTLATMFATSAG